MERAIAEGDYGKAEELSDRLATREVRHADKPSLRARRIELMGQPPFCPQRHKKRQTWARRLERGLKVLQPFYIGVNKNPSLAVVLLFFVKIFLKSPPLWALLFSGANNALKPSAKTFFPRRESAPLKCAQDLTRRPQFRKASPLREGERDRAPQS